MFQKSCARIASGPPCPPAPSPPPSKIGA